jgi:putative membrane protein
LVLRQLSAIIDDPMSPTAPERPREETLRLHQANERTLLAWVRTGIALMAFGFALARFAVFLHQVAGLHADMPKHPSLGSTWLGAALVALGMLANLLATLRFAGVRRGIERGDVGAPNATLVYVLGITVTLIGLAMTVLLARAVGEG